VLDRNLNHVEDLTMTTPVLKAPELVPTRSTSREGVITLKGDEVTGHPVGAGAGLVMYVL